MIERTWLDLGFDLALIVGLAGSLISALGPVTEGDALCYHLQVAKVFLANGSAGFDPDLHETAYPMGVEMVFLTALAARGPEACRLVSWLYGLVLAGAATGLARPVLGPRARWAGTLTLLVPAVSNGMGAALNDVALAAVGAAATLAWFGWVDEGGANPRGRLLLAGTLAGLAAGIKYPALVLMGLLGLATVGVVLARRGGARRAAAAGMMFGLAALVAGGAWYARAYHLTGNPVHPFFRATFGGSGLDEVLDPIKRPLAVTPWNLLTALGPITLDPDRFDSVAHQFGPAFLLFLPGLALLRPPGRVAWLAALGWAFLTICLTRRQSMRFVLIAVAPMAVAVAWLAVAWLNRATRPGRVVAWLILAVALFEGSIAAGRARQSLPIVLGRESRLHALTRVEPTWTVGRWVDAHLPRDARLIGQDHRGFYVPRPYTMEMAHRRRTGLGSRGESADDIARVLRDRGFTHLLMAEPVPENAVEHDPTLARRLAPWLDDGRLPLYREALTDGDGVTRRYAIFALDDPAARTSRRNVTRSSR
jgi:hypothetical protein